MAVRHYLGKAPRKLKGRVNYAPYRGPTYPRAVREELNTLYARWRVGELTFEEAAAKARRVRETHERK